MKDDRFQTIVLQSSNSHHRASQKYANMPTFCTRFSSCSQQATRSRPYRGVTLLSAAAAGCPIVQVPCHCRLLPAMVCCDDCLLSKTAHASKETATNAVMQT